MGAIDTSGFEVPQDGNSDIGTLPDEGFVATPDASPDPLAATIDGPAQLARCDASLLARSEPRWERAVYALLALLITAGFLYLVLGYWAPGLGMPGIDENAYLVGGRDVARTFSSALHPSSPFAFVGPMWFRAENGGYFPKYPIGVPMLDAIAIWIAPGHSVLNACLVSPVCASFRCWRCSCWPGCWSVRFSRRSPRCCWRPIRL